MSIPVELKDMAVQQMTDQQLLERVQAMSDLELDKRLSDAAYNKGWEDSTRGKQMGLYWIERYQDAYEVGFNRGSGRISGRVPA